MTYEVDGKIARITPNRPADQSAHHDKAAPESNRDGARARVAQLIGTVFDRVARHTVEGYAFQGRAMESGFREAVRTRDVAFGDAKPG